MKPAQNYCPGPKHGPLSSRESASRAPSRFVGLVRETRAHLGRLEGLANPVRPNSFDGHTKIARNQNRHWFRVNPSAHHFTPTLAAQRQPQWRWWCRHREPPCRRTRPPMGGYTAVERLLGGALPVRWRGFIPAVAPQPARWWRFTADSGDTRRR
jgi:hypothetical protein